MQGNIMGTPQGSGLNGPAPFLVKTYEMVDDPSTNSMVSWSHSGCSFIVWKPPEFTQYLLPSYFKHSNFSSFVRQLNTYGFRKIHPYQWEFANVDFVRGQKSLLTNIHRRKPIHSHSVQNQENISPLTEAERQELEDEIKRLKDEKAMLELKWKSYGRDKEAFEFQTQTLGERLQNMERRQTQLMPFLAQLIKKPEFASILVQRLQHDNKRRRLFESHCFHGEHKLKEDQTSPDRLPSPLVNFKLIDKLDSSLNFWENIFHEVDDNVGQEVSSLGTMPLAHPSTHNSEDIHSSPEQVGCANEAERLTSPASYPDPDFNIRPESPEFDRNIRPGNEEIKASETANHAMLAGGNDRFWQSFLTDSSVISEGEH